MNVSIKEVFNFFSFTLILIWLFSEYIKAATNLGGLSLIIPLIFYLASMLFLLFTKRKVINIKYIYLIFSFFSYLLLITIISAIRNPLLFDIKGFFFEVVKLSSFLSLIVLGYTLDDKYKKYLLYIIFIFLLMNTIVLILQFSFGVDFVSRLGMKYGMETHFFRNSRPTGLTNSSNTIGGFSVFSLFIALYLINTGYRSKALVKNILFLSISTIILSTSKQSIFSMLILFSFYSGVNFRKVIFGIVLGSVLSTFFLYYNIYGVHDKFSQYIYMLTTSDATVNFNYVETRAMNFFNAFSLFNANTFLGTGLGTWGDFSASFNQNNYILLGFNTMSDSYISHILVEHGIGIILYLYFVFVFIEGNEYRLLLFLITLILFMPSMGFSVPVFTAGFCLANLFMKKSEENNEYIKN
ncbi:hypothetical protein [Vibrio campbellii]|uniref:hypothetical protein n=1 Tax=Vibrio campbellii TaxID=680 RepID=UPI000CD359A9|nr:hypothetical protein [Vibrio campbellii]AUW03252.1 hypothetical protein C1N51_05430 [Vibrio campbellii]